ncbi:hypothetical protein N8148_03030 [Gammaproteobacteria bacterium]|nr:hypothetical protein [Gammaproteobacteria bacterium]
MNKELQKAQWYTEASPSTQADIQGFMKALQKETAKEMVCKYDDYCEEVQSWEHDNVGTILGRFYKDITGEEYV